MMRTTVKLTCPGTATNYTVIVDTDWQSRFGLGNPSNVGDCDLFIVPLDTKGKPIELGHLNVELKAGESRPWYNPPTGTAKIGAVCSKECDGTAILEYDTPSA